MHIDCKICGSATVSFGTARVMGKHEASYQQCQNCGFIFAPQPYWLPEAYSSAITSTDLGTVSRTDRNSLITKAVIDLFFGSTKSFLDYGAGYGMFVRRMRDLGYDFNAYDVHCPNMFAEQHAVPDLEEKHFDFTTAYEVFEHLEDPMSVAKTIFAHSDALLITTEVVPEPAPRLPDWWYYAPEHGQHVSFFTINALKALAKANDRFLYTNGTSLHLFSRSRINEFWFRKATTERTSQWLGLWRRRKSLLESDWRKHRKEVLTKLGYPG